MVPFAHSPRGGGVGVPAHHQGQRPKDKGQKEMNLLVLDTSTERAAIAVATATGGVYETATEAARRHGSDLIPQLSRLLGEAGLSVGDLDVVAVGLGPGSYTGLRVG